MTVGVINQALLGAQQHRRRFDQAAGDIVRSTTAGPEAAGGPPTDLLASVATLMTARRGLEACLAVAATGDELLGTVIDLLA